MNTPSWLTKAAALWVAIGSFLILIGAQGAALPSWLTGVFSQAFVDATIVAIGSVVTFYQFVRSIFVKTDANILSADNKLAYFINPFKTA